MAHLEVSEVHGIVISSVVPPLDSVLRGVCERYFSLKPLSSSRNQDRNAVLYDNPAEVGADRMLMQLLLSKSTVRRALSWIWTLPRSIASRRKRIHGWSHLSWNWNFRRCAIRKNGRLPRVDIRSRRALLDPIRWQPGLGFTTLLGLVDGILEICSKKW